MAKHGPNSLANYVQIHETVMAQFCREGFVLSDDVVLAGYGAGVLRMEGTIRCLGGLVCTVLKTLVVSGPPENPRVQTTVYSYNVSIAGQHTILRYDNVHAHPGHPDEHHRHEFDWRSGSAVGSPTWTGKDHGWPTLGEVLAEMRDWYWDHHAELEAAFGK